MAWQEAEGKVAAVKKELHVLAAQCKKAIAASGLLHSLNPQVQKGSQTLFLLHYLQNWCDESFTAYGGTVGLSERMTDKKL